MSKILDIIDELLVSGHPAVIHFPIIGIVSAFLAAMTALVIGVMIDILNNRKWLKPEAEEWLNKLIDRYEFASWILVIMGEGGLIIAAWTGFRSAGGVDAAANNELLAFKVRLSIYVFILLLTPLVLKAYLSLYERRNIFGYSRIVPILYLIPLMISAFLTILISGAGGRYTYGHSILDTLGLDWLLPQGGN